MKPNLPCSAFVPSFSSETAGWFWSESAVCETLDEGDFFCLFFWMFKWLVHSCNWSYVQHFLQITHTLDMLRCLFSVCFSGRLSDYTYGQRIVNYTHFGNA